MPNLEIEEIIAVKKILEPYVRLTPTLRIDSTSECHLKLEHLQCSGSFKFRGALAQALKLRLEERHNKLVAVSGGNHGIAVALVGRILQIPVQIFLDREAPPFRIKKCRALGADVVISESREKAFQEAQASIGNGTAFLHPFDHPVTIAATGTIGLEFCEQVPRLDAVIVPIGGGGLAAGLSQGVRKIFPNCKIIGVQSALADAMARSLLSGHVERNPETSKVAFSLCPPAVGKLTLEACKSFVDEVVTVSDSEIVAAMQELFDKANLMIEGAGATPWAALSGPLKGKLVGKKVGLIISGSNISPDEFNTLTSFSK